LGDEGNGSDGGDSDECEERRGSERSLAGGGGESGRRRRRMRGSWSVMNDEVTAIVARPDCLSQQVRKQ
jgi:hypothetical protein